MLPAPWLLPPATTGFKVGDGVLWSCCFSSPPAGAYAEYVLAPASVDEGARRCSLLGGRRSLAALTAYQAIFEVARLKEGERVLIHAGAGGVGHLAVQLAAQAGAQVLRPPRGEPRVVRSLGAQPIDYRTEDFRAVLGQTMDVVLNSTGQQTFLDSLEVLVPGGRIVTPDQPRPSGCWRERGFEAQWLTVHRTARRWQEIARLMSLGLLKVHVDQVLNFSQAAQAHALVGNGSHREDCTGSLTRR